MSLSHKRTGFTFLELLVFLAILAMLFGLLLPAVAKMREREGRTQKFNNLKQVALATHLYHDVNKVLPPATNNVGLFANYPGQATLSMHLLPYVEQQPLANQIQIGGKSLAVLIPAYQITDDPSTTDFISVQNIAGNVACLPTADSPLSGTSPSLSRARCLATRLWDAASPTGRPTRSCMRRAMRHPAS